VLGKGRDVFLGRDSDISRPSAFAGTRPGRVTPVLTEEDRELLATDVFGFLATLRSDGSPHVSAVWVEFENPHILIVSDKRFLKTRNVVLDPRISLAVVDPSNLYRQLVISGTVVSVDEEGAGPRADRLAKRYLGLDSFPAAAGRPHQPVTIRIAVNRTARGPA
jgi:PPOX class probable F420-dependent enzyme